MACFPYEFDNERCISRKSEIQTLSTFVSVTYRNKCFLFWGKIIASKKERGRDARFTGSDVGQVGGGDRASRKGQWGEKRHSDSENK